MVQQSFVFDMTLIETFWDNWNKTGWYGADTMTPSKTDYEIIIADTSNTNQLHDIDDAIENGQLKNTVNIHTGKLATVKLVYGGESGSWERTISFPEASTIDIGEDNIFVKALFIRHTTTKKVVAYCILSDRFPCTNKIIIPAGTIGWRIKENVRCDA